MKTMVLVRDKCTIMCWNNTVLGPRKIGAKMDQEYDTHGKEGDGWEE